MVTILVVKICQDEDTEQWCAYVGPDLIMGVAGYADTIKNALTELALTLSSDEINRFREAVGQEANNA